MGVCRLNTQAPAGSRDKMNYEKAQREACFLGLCDQTTEGVWEA